MRQIPALFNDAAHQEDVVVRAQCRQEDEGDEGHPDVESREVKRVFKQPFARTECGEVTRDDGDEQQQRSEQATQHRNQGHQHHEQHERDEEIAVVVLRVTRIESLRDVTAHQGLGHGRELAAQVANFLIRLGGARRRRQSDTELSPLFRLLRDSGVDHTVDHRQQGLHPFCLRRRRDDVGGVSRSGREVRRQNLLPHDGRRGRAE